MAKFLAFPSGEDITEKEKEDTLNSVCPICNNKNPKEFSLFYIKEADFFQLSCLKCGIIFILKDFVAWNKKAREE